MLPRHPTQTLRISSMGIAIRGGAPTGNAEEPGLIGGSRGQGDHMIHVLGILGLGGNHNGQGPEQNEEYGLGDAQELTVLDLLHDHDLTAQKDCGLSPGKIRSTDGPKVMRMARCKLGRFNDLQEPYKPVPRFSPAAGTFCREGLIAVSKETGRARPIASYPQSDAHSQSKGPRA